MQRPAYLTNRNRPLSSKDYYTTYRTMGGTSLTRDQFPKVLRELNEGLVQACIDTTTDIPIPYLDARIGVRIFRNKSKLRTINYLATVEKLKSLYGITSIQEAKKRDIKFVPVYNEGSKYLLTFMIGGYRTGTDWYKLQILLRYLHVSKAVYRRIHENINNGIEYYYRFPFTNKYKDDRS
jgi:hypothetical protein